jgi:tetratricopeptide (TPR) repeat protein
MNQTPIEQFSWADCLEIGDVLKSRQDRAGSMAFYRRAVELQPMNAEACFKLGVCQHDDGRLDEALALYLKAVHLKPNFWEAHYNAGLVYQACKRREEASVCYQQALNINPGCAEAHNNLGQLYLERGESSQALNCFRNALRLRADFAEAHFNMAEAFSAAQRDDDAVSHYQAALRLKPALAEAWNNLGNVLRRKDDPAGACRCYQQVVQLRPDLAQGHYNLGSAWKDMDELDRAVESLTKAAALDKSYAEAWNNLGLAYKNRGDHHQAIACFSEALRLKPELAEAHWNRSSVNLLVGDFAQGLKDYEWRFQLPKWQLVYPFRTRLPRWDGSADRSRRILVHDEQGLGDTLQFIRYIPMVSERCGRLILETRRELMDLLREFPGVDEVVERPNDSESQAEADVCIPLLSLPLVFGTTLETIPAVVPYLWADPRKALNWRRRIEGPHFKVGLVWAGRPQHQNDRNRSCCIDLFAPLARNHGIRCFSLQKGPAAEQLMQSGLRKSIVNLDPELEDFSDTAAVISQLDLVITVDTSVAHLAGAMGKPVWLLLPHIPDWRWMLEREDSPWYPTMRLFRQEKPGDWSGVFQRVQAALEMLQTCNPAMRRDPPEGRGIDEFLLFEKERPGEIYQYRFRQL